jgi:suppressor of fused
MADGAGRRAIDEALRAHHPRDAPVTFGKGVGVLAEIRAYLHPATDGDCEHWHYVTLGLTELDAKVSKDAEWSGWGFELTMRVEAVDGERVLPEWPVMQLAQLAAYVDETGRILEEGHQVSLEAPVASDVPSIRGLAMARDPELGGIDTPHGAVTFVQVVGITADEANLLSRWSTKSFLEVLAKQTPLLVTRPERPSLLRDPTIGPMLEQRAAADGSKESIIYADTLTWQASRWPRKRLRVSLGPADIARRTLRPLLASRTSRGQQFRITCEGRMLWVDPGSNAGWEETGPTLRLTVSPALAAELEAFFSRDQPALQCESLPGFVLALVE